MRKSPDLQDQRAVELAVGADPRHAASGSDLFDPREAPQVSIDRRAGDVDDKNTCGAMLHRDVCLTGPERDA
jgi:hypothetical protein